MDALREPSWSASSIRILVGDSGPRDGEAGLPFLPPTELVDPRGLSLGSRSKAAKTSLLSSSNANSKEFMTAGRARDYCRAADALCLYISSADVVVLRLRCCQDGWMYLGLEMCRMIDGCWMLMIREYLNRWMNSGGKMLSVDELSCVLPEEFS